MSLFCTCFDNNVDYAYVFLSSSRDTTSIVDSSDISESQKDYRGNSSHSAFSQTLSAARAAPRLSSAPTLLDPTQQLPLNPSINPEQFRAQYSLLDSKKVLKKETAALLRDKKKWMSSQNGYRDGLVVKMVRKSQYDTIIKSNKKDKWEDKAFLPAKTYKTAKQQLPLIWLSLEELRKNMNSSFQFMDGSIIVTDIVQGKVGDCYFLSSVAALTSVPERIQRLFSSIELNQKGIYMARLMSKGILQEVIVDDRFPVIAGTNELLGCKPSHPSLKDNEIYVMVLEKCWAKLWNSYDAIDGGFPHDALHALTGALTKNYMLAQETANPQLSQSFFKQVLGFCSRGYVMCTGTGNNEWPVLTLDHSQGDRKIKIAPEHIYCIMEFFEENEHGKVRMYNPWGYNNTENESAYSKGDFVIPWQEFIKNFKYLTVCKIHDKANYLFIELERCKNNKFTFIELNVFQAKNGYFAITVSETNRKDNRCLAVTFVVLKCSNTKEESYAFETIRTEYKFSDHYLELYGLTQGKYLVGIYFSQVQVKENLTFGVYSEATFGFQEKEIDESHHQLILEQALISFDMIGFDRQEKALESRIYPEGKDRDIWYSFQVMANKSIFGYLLLHVGKKEKNYRLKMGGASFTEIGLKVSKPYDKEKIQLEAEAGHETIAVISIDNLAKYELENRLYLQREKVSRHKGIRVVGEYF